MLRARAITDGSRSSENKERRAGCRSHNPRRSFSAALLVAALVVALPACSSNEARDEHLPDELSPPARADHRTTGERSELVSDLPVLTSATSAGKRVIFSQEVTVREGLVLLAVAEFQTTNDLQVNVYVGSQVVLAERPTDVTGKGVTAANGENVTPDMHHGQQSKTGTYQTVPGDVGTRHVNVVAWAAASRAAPGDLLRLDLGYGRLSVLSW